MTSEREPHFKVPEGAPERFEKEMLLIDTYVNRGKVKGDPLPLEKELPADIVSRARNRAELFLVMGWTNDRRPSNPNLLQRVKQFFHRK